MLLVLVVAACVLAAMRVVGAAIASSLQGVRDRAFVEATAPLLGLAAMLAVLDLVGLVLPLRVGAFALVPVVLIAVVTLARRRALASASRDLLPTALALLLGLVPVLVAGRATVASMTNDDATYYLAAAERLRDLSWLARPDWRGTHCLSELLVHAWLWRTGVPNLTAASSALFRIDATAAIAVVTAVACALVPSAAVAIALRFRLRDRARERAIVGAIAAVSAAPIFLGWQHLLGQLLAFSFFPVALVSLARSVSRIGARPSLHAALLLGAAVNVFADAGVILALGALCSTFARTPPFFDRARRVLVAALLAAALFPCTVWRALNAAYGTVAVRLPGPRILFPQRGWLVRGPLDDVSTIVGVDPWPPWPTPRPLTPAAALQLGGAVVGAVLLLLALVRLRRRRPLVAFALAASVVLVAVERLVPSRYLIAKWLLMDAAFVVPLAALAASRRARLGAIWIAAALAAVAQLARPSGFRVVDEPDHDRLVPELARLPRGALLVLDGFGAPADVVHDEHRAYRAAHLAGIVPFQPGLDGGYYKPRCEDPAVPTPLPARGFALQRDGAEALTSGAIFARFGRFTLREVDLGKRDAFVATWAPTHGFLRAETEPDGTVFRWAERVSLGTLRAIGPACARWRGEIRTVASTGVYEIASAGARLHLGEVSPVWSSFRTKAFSVLDAVPLEMRADVSADDPARAIATRKLALEPDASCVVTVERWARPSASSALPEPLVDERTYAVVPAAGVRCARVGVVVEAETPGVLSLRASDLTIAVPIASEGATLWTSTVDLSNASLVTVRRLASDGAPPWTVTSIAIAPARCEGS